MPPLMGLFLLRLAGRAQRAHDEVGGDAAYPTPPPAFRLYGAPSGDGPGGFFPYSILTAVGPPAPSTWPLTSVVVLSGHLRLPRVGSRYVIGRARAWLKTKNPTLSAAVYDDPATHPILLRAPCRDSRRFPSTTDAALA